MERLKKTREMTNYVKKFMDWDLDELRVLYNNFSDTFWLCVSFDILGNEDEWSLMCSVYSNKLEKYIIVEWNCKWYSTDMYNDLVEYLLDIDYEWKALKELAWD